MCVATLENLIKHSSIFNWFLTGIKRCVHIVVWSYIHHWGSEVHLTPTSATTCSSLTCCQPSCRPYLRGQSDRSTTPSPHTRYRREVVFNDPLREWGGGGNMGGQNPSRYRCTSRAFRQLKCVLELVLSLSLTLSSRAAYKGTGSPGSS